MARTRVFEVYQHLRDYEAGFDLAQATIRRTASLWILAAFAAIAYLLSTQYFQGPNNGTNPPLGFLIVLVCFAAVTGLFLLWYIDQNVYQRLLHSVFVYGCAMEGRFDTVPQLRRAMYKANLNISAKLGWFYKIPMLVFIFIILILMIIPQNSEDNIVILGQKLNHSSVFCIELLLLLLAIAAVGVMVRSEAREKDLFGYYGRHYDEEMKRSLAEFRDNPIAMVDTKS